MEKTQVLIVEDQLLAAKVAQSIIIKLDCVADIAFDGKTALKYLEEKKYDLVFMDVGLPDINGFDLTKEIRTKEVSMNKHIPIVALSACIDPESEVKCILCGMDAVLSKPLISNSAQEIISEFVPSHKKC